MRGEHAAWAWCCPARAPPPCALERRPCRPRHRHAPAALPVPAVAELLSLGVQLDTPLLYVGFRAPSLMPACLAPGSTALHMAAATGRAQVCVLLLHAQRTRFPGLELRRMRNARGMTPLNIALLVRA